MSQEREVCPTNFKPSNYNLYLRPDLRTFTFGGEIEITLDILESLDYLEFNAKELTFKTARISPYPDPNPDNPTFISCSTIELCEDLDRVTFRFGQTLSAGQYILYVQYEGFINDNMSGFYRSEYEAGKYLGITQFEAVGARRALPCVDEPAVKATFNLTMVIPDRFTALSNTPVEEEISNSDQTKIIRFHQTPVMSTYLLAFYVGPTDYVETTATLASGKSIQVRSYSPVGQQDQAKFANDLAAKVLEFYSDFFGQDYPLDKLDMIAAPDFEAGAMENWGLVIYRAVYLLCDDDTPISSKILVAYVVCHELAHQWFGNLVTMEWWSELWLNEGFATWVGWMTVDTFFPEWRVWDRFYSDEMCKAIELDSLHSSHAIQVELQKASQIDEIFDAITYSKGACVIKMLANYLGLDTFRNGLRHYLSKHAYENATTHDLWVALEEKSGKPVQAMMENWTTHKGFPIVRVKSTGEGELRLTQHAFNGDDTLWQIPLGVTDSTGMRNITMTENQMTIGHDTSLLNTNQNSFFITQYDSEMLDSIAKQIEDEAISAVDRAAVIDNLFSLAYIRKAKTNEVLKFLSKYQNETNHLVLVHIFSALRDLRCIYHEYPESVAKINALALELLDRPVRMIDWDGLPDVDSATHYELSRFNEVVIKAGVAFDHPDVMNRCVLYYVCDAIPTDIRRPIYDSIAKMRGEFEYQYIFARLTNDTIAIRQAALYSIGQFIHPDYVTKTLDMVFQKDSPIKSQDIGTVICSLLDCNREMTIDYVLNHWDRLVSLLIGGSFMLSRIVSECVRYASTEKIVQRFRDTFAQHESDVEAMQKTLDRAFEYAAKRILYATDQQID